MPPERDIKAEVTRIRGVSDMLCTGHAVLRDKFSRRALILDSVILGVTCWLVALAFADPEINLKLTPFHLSPSLWLGLLAVIAFLLTLIQLKVDWKSIADSHSKTLELYSEVKREAGYLLASSECTEEGCKRVFSRYDLASAVGTAIPEADFLALKRRHKLKIVISKHLDEHPAASILLLRIRLFYRDNLRRTRADG